MDRQLYVSVIVPTYNEEDYIQNCLDSIKRIDYPKERYEIIVVDNGSTDNTLNIAKRNDGVIALEKRDCLVGSVRNYGASKAVGEILAFIDGDCIVPKGLLGESLNVLNSSDNEVGAVGGGYNVPDTANWIESLWVKNQEIDSFEYVNALPGGCFILKKRLFEELGGFDEGMSAGEDDELSHRILDSGLKILKLKDCYVIHQGYPKDLTGIMKRQIWHGSHQIESADRIFDKVLIASHIFSVTTITVPIIILTNPFKSEFFTVFIGVLLMLLIPFISSVIRLSKGRNIRINISLIGDTIKLTTIFFFFFTGRMIGLFKNYSKYIIRK